MRRTEPLLVVGAVLLVELAGLAWTDGDAELCDPDGGGMLRLCIDLTSTSGACSETSAHELRCQVRAGEPCTLSLAAMVIPPDSSEPIEIRCEMPSLCPLPRFQTIFDTGMAKGEYTFTPSAESVGRQYRLRFFARRQAVAEQVYLDVVLEIVSLTSSGTTKWEPLLGSCCSETTMDLAQSAGDFSDTVDSGTTSGVFAELWHVDLQGDANHNGTYGQSGPLDHSSPSAYWNVFEVAALRQPWPTPYTAGHSIRLRDFAGEATDLTLTVSSDAYGWAGWLDGDSLTGDYLIVLNEFGVTNDPLHWELAGLVPNASYMLVFYHHDHGETSDRGLCFVANGVLAVVTGVPSTSTGSAVVSSDGSGRIVGTASTEGWFSEGDWAGLSIRRSEPLEGS